MKVVILAGGLGTRLSEETVLKPKPMVEIGGKPILWHIMKIYSSYGFNEFVICLGYKGYLIKEYFANYYRHESDITFDLSNNTTHVHSTSAEPWKVTLIDTGSETMTGGRIRRIRNYTDNSPFLLTYGDGVGEIDLRALVSFHQANKRKVTLTAVQPSGRFGALDVSEQGVVNSFIEKPKGDGAWINGGFFVCEQSIFEYLENDATILEREPLERLAREGELVAFKHRGFWKPMDTLRDKQELEALWESGQAPWKKWK